MEWFVWGKKCPYYYVVYINIKHNGVVFNVYNMNLRLNVGQFKVKE